MGSKMKRITTLLTIFGIWAILAPWGSLYAADDLMKAAGVMRFLEGQRASDFAIEDLEGNRVRLNDHRGKVVLVDFWATW